MSDPWQGTLLILLLGLVTYGTRVAGDLVLSRFERIHPRVEAALDAVPTAVMTALVAPMALSTGPAETIAALATVLAALKLPANAALAVGVAAVAGLRYVGV